MLKRRLAPKEEERPSKKRKVDSPSSEVESVEDVTYYDSTPIHLVPVEVLNTILYYCTWWEHTFSSTHKFTGKTRFDWCKLQLRCLPLLLSVYQKSTAPHSVQELHPNTTLRARFLGVNTFKSWLWTVAPFQQGPGNLPTPSLVYPSYVASRW